MILHCHVHVECRLSLFWESVVAVLLLFILYQSHRFIFHNLRDFLLEAFYLIFCVDRFVRSSAVRLVY